MDIFLDRHKIFWRDKIILRHLSFSVALLAISLYLFKFAYHYTNQYTGYVVPDILLDNIQTVNVSYVFFQGAFLFIAFFTAMCFLDPKYLPFSLEVSAAFFFVRSCFMSMTHLSAPAVEYYNYVQHKHHEANVLFTISSGNDLFFSGHVGYTFLAALVFWQKKPLRYIALACSVIAAFAVILGHLHYSIDVFSAYFIAYGVYEMSKNFFKKEYNLTTTITPQHTSIQLPKWLYSDRQCITVFLISIVIGALLGTI
jgi:membrane-associated phospholipid phosphatase